MAGRWHAAPVPGGSALTHGQRGHRRARPVGAAGPSIGGAAGRGRGGADVRLLRGPPRRGPTACGWLGSARARRGRAAGARAAGARERGGRLRAGWSCALRPAWRGLMREPAVGGSGTALRGLLRTSSRMLSRFGNRPGFGDTATENKVESSWCLCFGGDGGGSAQSHGCRRIVYIYRIIGLRTACARVHHYRQDAGGGPVPGDR